MNLEAKILFVAPSAYPLGGVAVWLHYLTEGLSSLGWKVYVGLVNGDYHQADKYLSKYSFENTVLINNPEATRYGRVKSISEAIIKTNADIVVSVNIPDVFDAVAVCKTEGCDVKAVMTIHGLEVDLFQDLLRFKDKVDAVISTNKLTELMVTDYADYPRERSFYAPYGVDVNQVEINGKCHQPIKILYAGRIEQPQKRCDDLLLMVKEMESRSLNYQLFIAGDGPDRKKLITSLERESKSGEINYLGLLNNESLINDVMPDIDLLILTSEWETGPIIVWEAIASGVGILSSRYVGSATEGALEHNKNCLLFDIGDIKTAVDHIELVSSSSMLKKLKDEAYAMVESRYSRQNSVEAWNKCLQNIAKQLVSLSPPSKRIENWPKLGRLERLFGHKTAHTVRRIMRRRAYVNSAGDEWPHSYTEVNSTIKQDFISKRRLLGEHSIK